MTVTELVSPSEILTADKKFQIDLNYVILSSNAYFLQSSYKHLSWLTITTLAAHAVIQEGLINIFGSVNYLQTIVSSLTRQMAPKVRLRPYRRIKMIGL